MREMVFRERHEKVAQMTAVGQMIAAIFNLNSDKYFGKIIADYAAEVFQEDYDVEILKVKAEALKAARANIARKRKEVQKSMSRLDKMGEFYDKKYGTDIRAPIVPNQPKPPRKKPTIPG